MEFFETKFLLIDNRKKDFKIEEVIDIFFPTKMFQLIVDVINSIFRERKNGNFRFSKIAESHLHDIRKIDILEFKLFYALLLKIENAYCLKTKKLNVGFQKAKKELNIKFGFDRFNIIMGSLIFTVFFIYLYFRKHNLKCFVLFKLKLFKHY
jgi:hypothetical protein